MNIIAFGDDLVDIGMLIIGIAFVYPKWNEIWYEFGRNLYKTTVLYPNTPVPILSWQYQSKKL